MTKIMRFRRELSIEALSRSIEINLNFFVSYFDIRKPRFGLIAEKELGYQ